LATGRARAVAVIPPGFGRRLRQGDAAPVQILVDGANANSASVAIGYLETRARTATLDLGREVAARLGRPAFAPPVAVEPRIWYNPTLDSSEFLVPGLIGFLLVVVGAVSTSLSVVKELERGTVEQIVVSATRPAEFILGKTLPYLVVLLITEAFIIAAAMVLFGMPLRGSLGWLLATSVVYLLGALGWGLFVSTVARTQQVAFQIATLSTLLPSLLLSDLVFPIASMPRALQWLTNVVPARHFIAILRSLILKGTGPPAWGLHLAVLAAFATLILAVAAGRLARDLERA
ncbi:MAG: ABC transporter permease, partial [Gemmatimonadota bacterium]